MNILVTGGAGYIGSIVTSELINLGHNVTVLDDLSTGHQGSIHPNAHFIQGSMLDRSAIKQSLSGVDAVLHFAAKSLVGESVIKPEIYWETNLTGSENLLNEMLSLGINKIVFSSTAAVYGDPVESPITESAATIPKNPYGESKLAVEELLTKFANEHNLAAISLRYFNVAGAVGKLGELHSPETHLIPKVLQSILNAENDFAIFGDDWPTHDGTCIRDYIHVADLADAHIKALGKLVPGEHLICNLGTGKGSSVLEVIAAIEQVTKTKVKRVISGRRDGDPAILVTSNQAAKQILGWIPKHDLLKIVQDAYRFMSMER
jgi:UDP-glucose 4-epimerase